MSFTGSSATLKHRKEREYEENEPVKNNFIETIKKLDVYPKTSDEGRKQTDIGGFVSLVSMIIMGLLLVLEISYYIRGETVDYLSVDLTRHEQLIINIDVTFHSLPCSEVNIDVMDAMGDPVIQMQTHIFKKHLDRDGQVIQEFFETVSAKDREKALRIKKDDCGDCHVPQVGDVRKCCNTCDDVKASILEQGWDISIAENSEQCTKEAELHHSVQKEEGCRFTGYLEVNKVAGNFHFAPGKSMTTAQGHHLHQFTPIQALRFNVSHTIHSLSFGDKKIPGVGGLLENTTKISEKGPGVFQYFTKIIPTTYLKSGQASINSYQYAVTEHKKTSGTGHFILPGVFVMYDLSPIRVTITETRESLSDFLTRLCAVIGGIFTLSGLTDTFVHKLVSKSNRNTRYNDGSARLPVFSS